MKLDKHGSETGYAIKAWNQEPEQCWEQCYASVKIYPQQAIERRHYSNVAPLGASVQPLRRTDSISRNITLRSANKKQFTFPFRTNPEGSAGPCGGENEANLDDLADHSNLFTKNTHGCDMSQFIAD